MGELRICMRTNGPARETKVNGRIVIKFGNLLDSLIVDTLGGLDENTTIFVSRQNFKVCNDRLKNNESDLSTEFYSYATETDFCSVPVPIMRSETSILTGFDVDDIKAGSFDAMDNFSLLDNSVYLAFLVFSLLITLYVIAATISHIRFEIIWLNMMMSVGSNARLRMRLRARRAKIMQAGYSSRQVRKQLDIFRGSSIKFRWILFLSNLLIFFLVTCFRSVYSTNSIILEKPALIDSHEELVEHPTARPMFIDFLANVGREFASAPPDSIRGRVNTKFLEAQSRTKNQAAFKSVNQIFEDAYRQMKTSKSVLIGSSLTLPTCKAIFCALSPEGKLRYMQIVTDTSEKEILVGFALSKTFRGRKLVTRRLQQLSQSRCFQWLLDRLAERPYEHAAETSGKSVEHIRQQKLLCDGDSKVDEYQDMHPISLAYWKPFLCASLVALLIATISLVSEIIVAKCTRRRHRSAQRTN